MQNVLNKIGVVQNLGWLDRVIRTLAAAAMLAVPCYLLITQGTMNGWFFYLMLFSVYPALTAIVGYDILYEWLGTKSYKTSERNQCGTFPYEIDAALGRHPIPDSNLEHSLSTSHHERHPAH